MVKTTPKMQNSKLQTCISDLKDAVLGGSEQHTFLIGPTVLKIEVLQPSHTWQSIIMYAVKYADIIILYD